MKIKECIQQLERIIPLDAAEGFDNVGLLVGDPEHEVKKILLCHDMMPEVVQEAVENGCQMIIGFHPIWFTAKKKLVAGSYVDDTLLLAIKNDIALYAIHTAWDKHPQGVSYSFAKKLGLKEIQPLVPNETALAQIVIYVPSENAEKIRKSLAKAGAGEIGNYDHCSFTWEGEGRFRPLDGSSPVKGSQGEIHMENEVAVTAIAPLENVSKIIEEVRSVHTYEEMAYQTYRLENTFSEGGLGCIGRLDEPMGQTEFLRKLKELLEIPMLKYVSGATSEIQKVAVLGGSGAGEIETAIKSGCDAYICGDLKYHDFLKAKDHILLIDGGHYETERWVTADLEMLLSEKLPTFAFLKSKHYTNPVKYFL